MSRLNSTSPAAPAGEDASRVTQAKSAPTAPRIAVLDRRPAHFSSWLIETPPASFRGKRARSRRPGVAPDP